MIPIVSLLVVVVVSLLVVRIATVALTLTGLSDQLARFQARSAFTGAGFTTTESEKVVQHPVRRRIIMLLMLLGNAGIVTAISSLMLSFIGSETKPGVIGTIWFRSAALLVGLTLLWLIAHSEWVDRRLSNTIVWCLKHWTDLEARDYAGLLRLSNNYAVIELGVEPADWLANRTLTDLKLADEGILVLGVELAGGEFIGAPRGHTKLAVGDTIIVYGPRDVLNSLDDRGAGSDGNWEHHKAVEKQREIEERERKLQQN